MIRSVPVIPPAFRPYAVAGNTFVPGDANELYRDLIQLRDAHDEAHAMLGDAGTQDTKLALYDSVKALTGYGEPVLPKTKQRGVSGFLKTITGSSPKLGFVQRKLLSKPQDSVARGVVTPDPDLGMDEVGIPKDMAWTMYAPYIQRRLVTSLGMSPGDALDHVTTKSDYATKALEKEIQVRPVIYSRAPSWHKFNVLAGHPKLVDGDSIKINNMVTTGQNCDFNGDEQIGRILVMVDKSAHSNILFSCLTLPISPLIVRGMFDKNIIPAFDENSADLFLVDLQDFPHGELQHRKENGRNGIIDFYNVPPGLKVVAYDEATGRPAWADVSFYSVHPQRLIELVHLSNGRQIITDDDPRAIYGLDPSDVTMSLRRFTPTEAAAKQVAVPVVKDVSEACQALTCLEHLVVGERRIALSWEFGYLLGALSGDGWWDKREYSRERYIYLADLPGQNAARVHVILSRLFGKVSWSTCEQFKADDDSRYGDSVRHTFSFEGATEFVQFLEQWLGGAATENSTGSGSKTLPDFFMLAPRVFREGVLNGIVDTDGSCSISNAKDKPQLICNVSSTSMRLICDVKFLCLTLGINATVGFSRTTIRGNTSWMCSISAPDAKRLNVFANLACDHKRNAFLSTPVAQNKTSVVFDKVPVPNHVWGRVRKDLPAPKIRGEERGLDTPDLTIRRYAQNMSQQWTNAQTDKILSRAGAVAIRDYLLKLDQESQEMIQAAIADLRDNGDSASPDRVKLWRAAILAVTPKQDTPERYEEGYRIYARINQPARDGRAPHKRRVGISDWLSSFPRYRNAAFTEEFQQWWDRFVVVDSMAWASVVSVQKTGIKEDGYDLTVPGYETFMNVDGVILSNTLNLHVPSHPDSVKEAYEKLLPSKMLFSIRDQDKVINPPKHEQILGSFAAQNRQAKNYHRFANQEQALEAIKQGKVALSDEVEVA